LAVVDIEIELELWAAVEWRAENLIVLGRSFSDLDAQQEYQNTIEGRLEKTRWESGVLELVCSVLLGVAAIVVVAVPVG
jgi:hypothetical protein